MDGRIAGLQVGIGLVAQVILATILSPATSGCLPLVVSVSYVLSSVGSFGIKTLMAQRSPGQIAEIRAGVSRRDVGCGAVCPAAGSDQPTRGVSWMNPTFRVFCWSRLRRSC